eukprot:Phypoly_transcript_29965.p1 GENE.Phypoly_transcript_29965~~Phypoly_transcript_29965.p1  ORF type:complete len:135 (-),score=21.28 Phypoly_transcript_29965:24-386(-)
MGLTNSTHQPLPKEDDLPLSQPLQDLSSHPPPSLSPSQPDPLFCFYHLDHSAVHKCQECGKGLCEDCIIEDYDKKYHLQTYLCMHCKRKRVLKTVILSSIAAVVMVLLLVTFILVLNFVR